MTARPMRDVKARSIHLPTLVAMAIVAYALANVAHEGLGHGGACLLVGGKPVALNAVYFDCDETGVPHQTTRAIRAGGTLVNLALGALTLLALRLAGRRGAATPTRYFLWLLATVNFLQATGYWLFSGIARVGDWGRFIEGWPHQWAWRVGLTLVGAGGYLLTIHVALRALLPFVGDGHDRQRRARSLTLVPYLTGGLLYVGAGLLNPISLVLVLISAGAASLGGTSALAWIANLVRPSSPAPSQHPAPALALRPSLPWILAAVVTAALFIVVLGRTVAL